MTPTLLQMSAYLVQLAVLRLIFIQSVDPFLITTNSASTFSYYLNFSAFFNSKTPEYEAKVKHI
jgi:hypothetical protein